MNSTCEIQNRVSFLIFLFSLSCCVVGYFSFCHSLFASSVSFLLQRFPSSFSPFTVRNLFIVCARECVCVFCKLFRLSTIFILYYFCRSFRQCHAVDDNNISRVCSNFMWLLCTTQLFMRSCTNLCMHMKIIFININVIVKRESKHAHANFGGSTHKSNV